MVTPTVVSFQKHMMQVNDFLTLHSHSAGYNMNNAILQLHIKYEQTRN